MSDDMPAAAPPEQPQPAAPDPVAAGRLVYNVEMQANDPFRVRLGMQIPAEAVEALAAGIRAGRDALECVQSFVAALRFVGVGAEAVSASARAAPAGPGIAIARAVPPLPPVRRLRQ